jgi:hypothetical protein
MCPGTAELSERSIRSPKIKETRAEGEPAFAIARQWLNRIAGSKSVSED